MAEIVFYCFFFFLSTGPWQAQFDVTMLKVWRMLYFNALLVLLTLFSCK